MSEKIKKKKAISLMLSYVLLVSIGIVLAVSVYTWLKLQTSIRETPKCSEDTSLIIKNYTCTNTGGTEQELTLKVSNKGLFNVDGYYVRGTHIEGGEAIFPLKTSTISTGKVTFTEGIKPNEEDIEREFTYDKGSSTALKKIEVQPFIIKNKEEVLCKAVSQPVTCTTSAP